MDYAGDLPIYGTRENAAGRLFALFVSLGCYSAAEAVLQQYWEN